MKHDGVNTVLVLSIDCSDSFFESIAIKVELEGECTLTTPQLSTCKDNALAVISLHFSYHSIDTLYVHLILYLETLTATVYSWPNRAMNNSTCYDLIILGSLPTSSPSHPYQLPLLHTHTILPIHHTDTDCHSTTPTPIANLSHPYQLPHHHTHTNCHSSTPTPYCQSTIPIPIATPPHPYQLPLLHTHTNCKLLIHFEPQLKWPKPEF